MASSINICPICGLTAEVETLLNDFNQHYYLCYICGRFALNDNLLSKIDKDKLASYLYYNFKIYLKNKDKHSFLYIGNEKQFEIIKTEYPLSICVTIEEIANWYPKDFNEKIDTILLGLSYLSSYHGQNILFENYNHFLYLFFIKKFINGNKIQDMDIHLQAKWLSDYFSAYDLLTVDDRQIINILPAGWKRIDELQKNFSLSKQVFVAMSFSDEMKGVREAIREGVEKSGYIAHFIDEKEHNNQIVPEMLYEIRKSKFLIAELTGHNNGAYYEAGYAAGLGKEVIHICSKETFGKDGHFDVKQKSSILWGNESDIASLLYKRIEATIGLGN